MSWPSKVWDPHSPDANEKGMVDYKPPIVYGAGSGLPDDWEDMEYKGDIWDIEDNPLYEAAFEALGYGNLSKFTEKVSKDWGTREEYQDKYGDDNKTVVNEEAYSKALSEWEADEDAGSDEKPSKDDFTTGGDPGVSGMYGAHSESMAANKYRKMRKWIEGNFKEREKAGDYSIMEKGPQGSDYGIEGDILEHYGLDKKPEDPKALDDSYFSYEDNFAKPVPWGGDTGAGLWIEAATDMADNPTLGLEGLEEFSRPDGPSSVEQQETLE